MEPPFFGSGSGSGGNPAEEAQRWLSIAEKLLAARDLMGSKSFATRARDSDPNLLPAYQILAVVDTLIAAEKRFGFNNSQLDWYLILQLGPTHDSELIASQYRQLAILLNPQKNKLPFADQAFRLVVEAWAVLSNPSRKRVYDNEIGFHFQPQINPAVTLNFAGPGQPVQENQQSLQQQQQLQHHQQQQQRQVEIQFGNINSNYSGNISSSPVTRTFIEEARGGNVANTANSSVRVSGQEERGGNVINSNYSGNITGSPITRPFIEEVRGGNVANTANSSVRVFGQEERGGNVTVNASSNQNVRGTRQQERGGNVTNQNVRVPGQEERGGNVTAKASANQNVWVPRQQERGADVTANTSSNQNVRGGNAAVNASTSNNAHVLGQEERGGSIPVDVSDDVPVSEEERGENEMAYEVEGTFWTACPYCFHMFEYPKIYLDCALRCQNCRNVFQGVEVASPPPTVEGKEAYFCCWGYMPMAVSVKDLARNGDGASGWAPFSPMFTCPQMPGSNAGDGNPYSANNLGVQNANVAGGSRNMSGRKSSGGPRIYVDDDEVFVEVSSPSEDSDDDWQNSKKKKKTASVKGKGTSTATPSKNVKKQQVEKAKNVLDNSEAPPGGFVIQEGVGGMVNVGMAESSKKGPASNTRRQSGRVAKDFGKLDLNVEFSNEVEEPAPRRSHANGAGRGDEDNFEGTGFFEGLDEFLSSLPILNVVGDDKIKAA